MHSPGDTGWKFFLQIVAWSSGSVEIKVRPAGKAYAGVGGRSLSKERLEGDGLLIDGNGGAIDKQKTVASALRQYEAPMGSDEYLLT